MNNEKNINDQQLEQHQLFLSNYSDLFIKSNKPDSAFYYQEKVINANYPGKVEIEKYAVLLEEVQGISKARIFIENQLSEGIYSVKLLNQLEHIYKQLGLSEKAFVGLKENYISKVKHKRQQQIKMYFGTTKAPDFKLRNLTGDYVSLSDLQGKVVVLDFWATWCRPCKASFPLMQELVSKYETSKEIEFLFIDVREQDEPEITYKKVKQYMQKEGFTFNVLFDDNDKVASSYKIDMLPAFYIIDRKGNIAFINNTKQSEDVLFEIEAELEGNMKEVSEVF